MYNKSAQVSFTEKLKTALMSSVIPEIRTFHSLALKIVGYGERQQIIKKKDLITPSDYRYEQLVKQAYRYGFDHEANYIDPNEIENFELFIARCRAAAVTPVDAANDQRSATSNGSLFAPMAAIVSCWRKTVCEPLMTV